MTNQEIEQSRQEFLNGMTEEERQAWLEQEAQHDREMASYYSDQLGVAVEVIPNDPNHIRVDGEVMGYEEFGAYCELHLPEEHEEEYEELDNEDDEVDLDEYEEDEEEVNEHPIPLWGGGWFGA